MRRVILIGLAASALGACAATDRVGPDMTWGLFENPHEGAKLVLGVPETDHVLLMMTCRPHSGRIALTVIGRTDDPAAVDLQSGKLRGHYSGVGVADDEIEGGRDIELNLTTDDPVIARLAHHHHPHVVSLGYAEDQLGAFLGVGADAPAHRPRRFLDGQGAGAERARGQSDEDQAAHRAA